MSQIPIHKQNFIRLNRLRSIAIIEKQGSPVTWNDILSTSCDLCDAHPNEFASLIRKTRGRLRRGEADMEDEMTTKTNEKIKHGERITSEDLKKTKGDADAYRFKE